jgi:hypothetical protein
VHGTLATPLDVLPEVALAMQQVGLDVVLVGNAAALLHGIDVETADLDFLLVGSRAPRRKLLALAAQLHCEVTRPFYHRGLRWRLTRAQPVLVADVVNALDGFSNVAPLLERALFHHVGGARVRVASLEDVRRSQRLSSGR